MKKRLLDVQLPFFIPIWRRIALVAACFGWAIFELSLGNHFWAGLFCVIGAYCAHQFFFAFEPTAGNAANKNDDTDEGGSS